MKHITPTRFILCAFVAMALTGCDERSEPQIEKANANEALPSLDRSHQNLTTAFEEADNDGDGVIIKREADSNDVQYHFTAIDKDNNEVLTKTEFDEYVAEFFPGKNLEEADREPTQAESRERASLKESNEVITDPSLYPTIENDFSSIDENNDSIITRDESQDKPIHDHFAQIDTDNNNQISQGEFKSYIEKHRGQVATEAVLQNTAFSN